jgi:hypothetical protein
MALVVVEDDRIGDAPDLSAAKHARRSQHFNSVVVSFRSLI